MENQRKWVVISYLCLSALVAYVFFALMTKAVGAYDLEARIRNADLVVQGIAAGVGAILFFVLFSNSKVNQFTDEVFAELSRVTWPTRSDTSKATVVVVIMVIISGVVLGGLDTFWTWLLKFVL